ncbi:unnamed protein product [Mytilus edulis]|uniref:SAP domain-containing protein n=1 Tax=Mytilus edulis TaxID=6550 RepID=A0A8S3UT48_MYTED|nr:unnamed protein product [Mytilus edulis]
MRLCKCQLLRGETEMNENGNQDDNFVPESLLPKIFNEEHDSADNIVDQNDARDEPDYTARKFKMDNTDNAFEEFSSNTIGKLKDFLSARGLSCMGNKQQLVSRCFVAWESNIPLRYSEQEQQSKLKTEYANRLKEANIDDPRSLKDDDWSSDVKVFFYFI